MDKHADVLQVLIVEDNPGDLFLLQEYLQLIDIPNKVVHVARLSELTGTIEKDRIDVCFLDLSLPDSSGLNTFISVNNELPHTPIIILSGLSDKTVSLEAISLGAQDYLLKGEYDITLLTKSIQYSIERKKMLERLRRTNERYELVNQATNDIIWEWDIVNKKLYWGDGIYTVFGYNKEEVNENPRWAFQNIHPEEQNMVVNHLKEQIKKGDSHYTKDFRYRCADGSYKNVYGKGYLVFDKENNPVRMIGVLADVTEKIGLQEQLNWQKLQLQKNLTEATIQAQEKEREELGRELHDNINQILASSKMYLNLGMANPAIREEMILKSSGHINRAIEEIRKLSKTLIVPSLGEMGLKELITDLLANISETTAIRTNVTFNNFDENNLEKKLKLMLFRIVQEQCNNILKHAHADNIVLSMSHTRNRIMLNICDDGVGFDSNTKAAGIGLSNIKSRVDVYSGKMKMITSPGNGCELIIEMPKTTSAEVDNHSLLLH
jgi:two-component system, NarL family, sensor histidine kinase UhpB